MRSILFRARSRIFPFQAPSSRSLPVVASRTLTYPSLRNPQKSPKIFPDALSAVRSNVRDYDTIFIHSAAATPLPYIAALQSAAHDHGLKGCTVCHIHTESPPLGKEFEIHSFFVGANYRKQTQEGVHATYIPAFLSEIPALFRERIVDLDVAFIQVSPPDRHGCVSLGVSCDISLAALFAAKRVIAQVNPNMIRTHGDGFVHIDQFDAVIYATVPLWGTNVEQKQKQKHRAHTLERAFKEAASQGNSVGESSPIERIAKHVAELIPNRSCLQLGIGAIPDAVLAELHSHTDLGIHSEMISSGVTNLVDKGVITGRYKETNPHSVVCGFAMGNQALYDVMDDNPQILVKRIEYVNSIFKISSNPGVVSINSAIQIDLTGQVAAEGMGYKHYSGVGGQLDFVRGATLSKGGKSIFAMCSRTHLCDQTKKSKSKIVPVLDAGAAVTTTRSHVQFVATEYGVVDLRGQSVRERAKRLISIAHPEDREWLKESARNIGLYV